MKPTDYQPMFGSTPESFERRVASALKKTEEKPMKHLARTILLTAATLLLLMAAAYAAFSSQVTEFFGRLYGSDMKTWLEQGDAATVGQALTLDGIVFTLDEVVYKDNGLYGIGTIRPQDGSNAVILPEDHMPGEPFGYDIYGEGGKSEQAPDGTPTLADVAKEKGGKLLVVRTLPDQIGVDGGEMLCPVSIGYAAVPQRDGSLRFSFEATDAVVIAKGDTYTIRMWASVYEMTPGGAMLEDTRHTGTWTVVIAPERIAERTPAPAATADAPAQSIGDVKLTVPDAYAETGTLPVYRATARDFGADLQPALFNQSGVAKTDDYLLVFNDEAQLSWAPEALFYNEYEGTYNGNYKDPSAKPDLLPLPTLRHAAADLAGNVYSQWPDEGKPWEGVTLINTALSTITLDEAKAEVEKMLSDLHVEGYLCDYALDMDAERIQNLGAVMNRMIRENQYWNPPIIDYAKVSQDDEGYFLHYQNGVTTGDSRFDLCVYVTKDGIANLQLRDMYIRGDVVETPASLVTPETVMARLPREMANSRFGEELASILSVELVYTPARAGDKTDGMVFTPAWYVVYRDTEGSKQNFDSYALFNAVDGTLLGASFQ